MMDIERVREIPEHASPRAIDASLDGKHAWLQAKLLAGVASHFDVKGFLESRYGPPDVVLDEHYAWRFKLEKEFYAELRLKEHELIPLVDDANTSPSERQLILSHFLDMFSEESKSIWDRTPLGMDRIVPKHR